MKTRLLAGPGQVIPHKTIVFPGGEVHVTIDPLDIPTKNVLIDARVRNSQDFLEVLALKSALDGFAGVETHLHIPYFPGARMDREELGHELGVKLYADIIDRAGFETVSFLDPHSPVLPALFINPPYQLSSYRYLAKFIDEGEGIPYLLSPDAGAEKRTYALAKSLGHFGIVYGRKHRDPETGKLTRFSVDNLPTHPARIIVVDDICDGGGTFLGLAAQIQKCHKLELFVSHMISDRPVIALLNAGYKRIGTTDSFLEVDDYDFQNETQLRIYPLDPFAET